MLLQRSRFQFDQTLFCFQTSFPIHQSNIFELLPLNRKGRLKNSDGLDIQALQIKRTIHAS